MNSKITLIIFSIFFFFRINNAQDYKIDEHKYEDAIDFMFSFRMRESIEELDRLRNKNANDPMVYFIESTVLYYISLIQKNNISDPIYTLDYIEKEFNQNIEKALKLTEGLLKESEQNNDVKLILGAIYGFRGLFALNQGKFISGYKDGKKGFEQIKQIIDVDTAYVDAYFGIGLFNLFTGYVPWYASWLISSGDKNEGLKQMKNVIDNANFNFTKYFSIMYLSNFYYLEYQDSKSKDILQDRIDIIEIFLSKYPENYIMKLDLAGCYGVSNEEKTIEIYEDIYKYAERIKNKTLYEVAIYSLVDMYKERKELEKVIEYYDKIRSKTFNK